MPLRAGQWYRWSTSRALPLQSLQTQRSSLSWKSELEQIQKWNPWTVYPVQKCLGCRACFHLSSSKAIMFRFRFASFLRFISISSVYPWNCFSSKGYPLLCSPSQNRLVSHNLKTTSLLVGNGTASTFFKNRLLTTSRSRRFFVVKDGAIKWSA